jgi:SAM-dependent methyltransferase
VSDAKASARRWFDRRARGYESGYTPRWRDPVQNASLSALELDRDDRVLDVGCGTGRASRAAAETAGVVVGVDLSPEMIERAQEFAGDAANVRFEVADIEQLPFDDAEFTAVVCSNAFHHFPAPPRAGGGGEGDGARPHSPADGSSSATHVPTSLPLGSPTSYFDCSSPAMCGCTGPASSARSCSMPDSNG